MANKNRTMSIRLSDEEKQMIKELRLHPFYVNMSDYLRACIKHLYKSRMSKAGRVSIAEKTSLSP